MSIQEKIDPNSGAILFKRDKDTKNLLSRVAKLEKEVEELKKELKKKNKKDS